MYWKPSYMAEWHSFSSRRNFDKQG